MYLYTNENALIAKYYTNQAKMYQAKLYELQSAFETKD